MTQPDPRDQGEAENEASADGETPARPTGDGERAPTATATHEAAEAEAAQGQGEAAAEGIPGLTARGQRAERIPLRLILGALVGLIVVAAVFAAIRPASDNPDGLNPAPVALRAGAPTPFPVPAPIREATIFATDGDLQADNVPVWQIEPRQSGVLLWPISVGDRPAEKTVRLPLRPRSRTSYDIAGWNTYEAASLFAIRQRPRSIEVRVYDLLTDHRLIGSGVAPTAPPEQPGVTREFAVARWEGNRSDLFVIDRGGRNERVRLSVYSGESAFSERVAAFVLPVRGVAPARWAIDVLRFDGSRPDLALVQRQGESGRPALHVLSGESSFQQFALQSPIGLPADSGPRYKFMAGSALGRSAIYALDLDLPGFEASDPDVLKSRPTLRVLPAGEVLGPLDN